MHQHSRHFPPPPTKVNFPVYHPSPALQTPPDKLALLAQEIYPQIQCKRYSTLAIDPQRTFLTVYEYEVCRHWVIWDFETGYVHLTGIWKAALASLANGVNYGNDGYGRPVGLERAPGRLGPATPSSSRIKADIFKLLESTPREYQLLIKRIRGGFLKIQGTWLPYQLCKVLCSRFCWNIRFELIPLFGSDFPSMCLNPSCEGYGELRLDIDRSLLPPPPPQSLPINAPQQPPQFFHLVPSASVPQPSAPLHHQLMIPPNVASQPLVQIQEMTLGPSAMPPGPTDSQMNQHLYNYILPKAKSTKQIKVTKRKLKSSPRKEKKASPTITHDTSPLSVNLTPASNYFYRELQWDRSNLSSNEIVDILNASRCLQLLSKGGYEAPPTAKGTTRHSSLETTPSLLQAIEMTPMFNGNYNTNYSITPSYKGTSSSPHAANVNTDHYLPATPISGSVNESFKNSVSNLLMAAEGRPSSITEPQIKQHSRNLSINDLLS